MEARSTERRGSRMVCSSTPCQLRQPGGRQRPGCPTEEEEGALQNKQSTEKKDGIGSANDIKHLTVSQQIVQHMYAEAYSTRVINSNLSI